MIEISVCLKEEGRKHPDRDYLYDGDRKCFGWIPKAGGSF